MKNIILLVITFSLLQYSCTSPNLNSNTATSDSTSMNDITADSAYVYDIALRFESDDIYKELVRRNTAFTDSILSFSKDTIPSANSYNEKSESDYLDTKKDSLLIPIESDTIILSGVKEELKSYTNEELFAAYNTIINARNQAKSVYYGFDTRQDITDTLPQHYLTSSKMVFALIEKKYFQNNGSSFHLNNQGLYANVYKLCNTEKFAGQNVYANCTAFAISQNTIASAGHCISKYNFHDYLLVTDFTLSNLNYFDSHGGIPADNVYEITGVLDSKVLGDQIDYSIFTVNKVIPNDRIVKLSNKTSYDFNDKFYVIGFPCGLPMKICSDASFRLNNNPYFFQISSDTYGGNSGSPVFNEKTDEVEGILVRGNTDFYLIITDVQVQYSVQS